jgi:hypothetical protein
MSNEVQHPGRIDFNNPPNDYENNGHNDLSDPRFRWNGSLGTLSSVKPLSNEALAAMRDTAQVKNGPLSDEERAEVLLRFQ